jgi:hypothetical protein
MAFHEYNAHSHRVEPPLLSQTALLLDESRALSYALATVLAHTPRENLSREQIDGLCQLAYELVSKLAQTDEIFQEMRQKLLNPAWSMSLMVR